MRHTVTEREHALSAYATQWSRAAAAAGADYVQAFAQDIWDVRAQSQGGSPTGTSIDRRRGLGVLLRCGSGWSYEWRDASRVDDLVDLVGRAIGSAPRIPARLSRWPTTVDDFFLEGHDLFTPQGRADPPHADPPGTSVRFIEECFQTVNAVTDSDGVHVSWRRRGVRRRCVADMNNGSLRARGFGRWFGAIDGDRDSVMAQVRMSALRQSAAASEGVSLGRRNTPVVFGPGAGACLLHELVAHGLEADNYRNPASYLNGSLGTCIAHAELVVRDDPMLAGGFGSIATDDEGAKADATPLLDRGVVVGLVHSRRSSLAAGVTPTGNGRRRDYRFPALPRATNTVVAPGSLSASELAPAAGWPGGLLRVHALGAGNVNINSGQFNFVATEADYTTPGGDLIPLAHLSIFGDALVTLRKLQGVANDAGQDNTTCSKQGQFIGVGSASPSMLFDALDWRS
jgi:predicted Zn-dependent protease